LGGRGRRERGRNGGLVIEGITLREVVSVGGEFPIEDLNRTLKKGTLDHQGAKYLWVRWKYRLTRTWDRQS